MLRKLSPENLQMEMGNNQPLRVQLKKISSVFFKNLDIFKGNYAKYFAVNGTN